MKQEEKASGNSILSNDLKKAAEEYAKDETMAGLAERAFKAGANWQKEQRPAEWSYEDESNLQSCIAKIEIDMQHWGNYGKTMVDGDRRLINWLKSLRPQSNTEWSEEDERIRLACIATINDVIDYERERWEDYNPGKPYRPITKYDEQIDWLKSLKK